MSRALVVLDTNIWIEAAKSPSSASAELLPHAGQLNVRIAISRHSLSELHAGAIGYGDQALRMASAAELLPYYPIGTIGELLGTIQDLAGTIDDMTSNEALRSELGHVAKHGAGIRDRGALIDAARARASMFISYDNALVGIAPAARIQARLKILVLRPSDALAQLRSTGSAG